MAELKHLLIVCEDREFWLRASNFECTDPGEDGTFAVDLFVRGRRVGQFSGCIGVYISQAKPEFSAVQPSRTPELHIPDEWG